YADYVKIEVLDKTEQEIRFQLDQLKPYPVKTIAEKVQTQELQHLCEQMGFDYFQGFFFCRPQLVKQKTAYANRAVVFNLLSSLQNPEVDFAEIEAILAQDVTLSYKLLRYINSAAFSLRREIDSIKDAAVLLGVTNIRNWVTLILMSKLTDEKPAELIVIAMIRGKMCELLANKLNPAISPQMFIIGLFSVLDALMDTPMIELLDNIALSIPIKMALLDQSGQHGDIYKQVMMYEQMEWRQLVHAHLSPGELAQAYLTAVHWADESMKTIA
ncbi:MAG: HDOD domain-containing protein, partial [Gammaproteobacteria bacterium]